MLVNNGRYGYTAAIEEGEDEAVPSLFATNFFGPVDLFKAALPGIRRRGSRLIVNNSSVCARIAFAGGGYCFRREGCLGRAVRVAAQGGRAAEAGVMVVESGSMRTEFCGRSADQSDIRIGAHDRALGQSGDSTIGPQRGMPVRAAAAILQATEADEPPNLLILVTDALGGIRAAVADIARDVDRFEEISRSTDAAP